MARDKVAAAYEDGLGGKVVTPYLAEGLTSAWAQYTLIVDDRSVVQAKLKKAGVPSVVYYPKALTQQDGYSSFPVVSSGVAVSEHLTSKVLSLPMHPYLFADDQAAIIEALQQ
jgi:dTDP-4-amino-4,6-dideoxygalactose transaminase